MNASGFVKILTFSQKRFSDSGCCDISTSYFPALDNFSYSDIYLAKLFGPELFDGFSGGLLTLAKFIKTSSREWHDCFKNLQHLSSELNIS